MDVDGGKMMYDGRWMMMDDVCWATYDGLWIMANVRWAMLYDV